MINTQNKMTEPYFNASQLMNETNTNQTYENITAIFNDDLVRVVSISVFISFSFIFLAGLVGNGLVVMGKFCLNTYSVGGLLGVLNLRR